MPCRSCSSCIVCTTRPVCVPARRAVGTGSRMSSPDPHTVSTTATKQAKNIPNVTCCCPCGCVGGGGTRGHTTRAHLGKVLESIARIAACREVGHIGHRGHVVPYKVPATHLRANWQGDRRDVFWIQPVEEHVQPWGGLVELELPVSILIEFRAIDVCGGDHRLCP